ncbi:MULTISPECIES: hypothetical protein [unclassified Actinotalea]|uniref:hypothetical protein n=1 Tax=unclassified Actinotalea TaxID=2638618 RepID=UPI0015F74C6A|nr:MULTISPECIES: hypothetical protein [unclassified Actinotalea]
MSTRTPGGVPGNPDVTALLADLRAATASVRAVAAQQEQERQAFAAQTARQEEERAKAARAGELGPDWRTLQQRIDLGQTSLAAILAGADEHPAAQRVLDHAMDRMVEIREEIVTALAQDDAVDPRRERPAGADEVVSAAADAQAAADEIARTLARLRERAVEDGGADPFGRGPLA